MAEPGVFHINPLRGWRRDAILKAAQLVRDRFGNPPSDPLAKSAHDGLLEVLDPVRRTVRLQREMSEATRKAALTAKTERRARERRATERRKASVGPSSGVGERRAGERRAGERRRR